MSTGAVVLICLLVLLGASVLRWDAVKARLMSWFDPPPREVGPGLVEDVEQAPRHLHEAQAHHAPAAHKPEIHRSGRRG